MFNVRQQPNGLIAERIKKAISVIYHFLVNATEQVRHHIWREGSGSYRGYKYSRGSVGAAREPQNHISSVLSVGFWIFRWKKNRGTENWEMDNWKIQFMVVTFVAFLQTYEAASSAVAEERWLPEHWQVKSLFFEIANNEVQKYQFGLKFHLFKWKFSVIWWQHEAFNMAEVFHKRFEFEGFGGFFLAELIGIFLYFVLQNESGEEGLSHQMVNLMKRAKALRFYGLMGKRSGTEKLICDKENMN